MPGQYTATELPIEAGVESIGVTLEGASLQTIATASRSATKQEQPIAPVH
jgi:hypothetical protein